LWQEAELLIHPVLAVCFAAAATTTTTTTTTTTAATHPSHSPTPTTNETIWLNDDRF
jgi:hypothetical protein